MEKERNHPCGQTKRRTFCPPLTSSPAIVDCFRNSGLQNLVESLVGRIHDVGGAQVALVFPKANSFNVTPPWFNRKTINENKSWHIDGTGKEDLDKVERVGNFTMLVGVYLSEADRDFCGNLTVRFDAPKGGQRALTCVETGVSRSSPFAGRLHQEGRSRSSMSSFQGEPYSGPP